MSTFKPSPTYDQPYWDEQAKCDDCGKVWPCRDLDWIDNAEQRLFAGEIVPAGQCPDPECGACCHLIDQDPKTVADAIEKFWEAMPDREEIGDEQYDEVAYHIARISELWCAQPDRYFCPQCHTTGSADEVGTTCRECGRGVIIDRTQGDAA